MTSGYRDTPTRGGGGDDVRAGGTGLVVSAWTATVFFLLVAGVTSLGAWVVIGFAVGGGGGRPRGAAGAEWRPFPFVPRLSLPPARAVEIGIADFPGRAEGDISGPGGSSSTVRSVDSGVASGPCCADQQDDGAADEE